MRFSFVSFTCLFLCSFLGSLYLFRGKAWVEGKGELATSLHRADSGREKRIKIKIDGDKVSELID